MNDEIPHQSIRGCENGRHHCRAAESYLQKMRDSMRTKLAICAAGENRLTLE